MSQTKFQETCAKCGQIISGITQVTLKQNMGLHLKKHEIEAQEQVAFEALPLLVEQAKKDAPEIFRDEIATVVDKWFDANYVYVRVKSSSGSETVMKYDAVTRQLVSHSSSG